MLVAAVFRSSVWRVQVARKLLYLVSKKLHITYDGFGPHRQPHPPGGGARLRRHRGWRQRRVPAQVQRRLLDARAVYLRGGRRWAVDLPRADMAHSLLQQLHPLANRHCHQHLVVGRLRASR